MQEVCSSETSVDFQHTTRRYIPEYSTLHNHRCEDLHSRLPRPSPFTSLSTHRDVFNPSSGNDVYTRHATVANLNAFLSRRYKVGKTSLNNVTINQLWGYLVMQSSSSLHLASPVGRLPVTAAALDATDRYPRLHSCRAMSGITSLTRVHHQHADTSAALYFYYIVSPRYN
jgi:hypothetical protein